MKFTSSIAQSVSLIQIGQLVWNLRIRKPHTDWPIRMRLMNCPICINFTKRQNRNCANYARCTSNLHGTHSKNLKSSWSHSLHFFVKCISFPFLKSTYLNNLCFLDIFISLVYSLFHWNKSSPLFFISLPSSPWIPCFSLHLFLYC